MVKDRYRDSEDRENNISKWRKEKRSAANNDFLWRIWQSAEKLTERFLLAIAFKAMQPNSIGRRVEFQIDRSDFRCGRTRAVAHAVVVISQDSQLESSKATTRAMKRFNGSEGSASRCSR